MALVATDGLDARRRRWMKPLQLAGNFAHRLSENASGVADGNGLPLETFRFASNSVRSAVTNRHAARAGSVVE